MKQIFLIIMTFVFISCSMTNKLNKKIDKSQRKSLKHSPFETASGMNSELKMQKKYRTQYENELNEIIKINQNDTIILTENYDFICFGCPADYVQIFLNNNLITYKKSILTENYERTTELLIGNLKDTTGYVFNDIAELKNEIRKGNSWNAKPEKYGTDDCFDGGHSFYTVIYPTGKIESLYIRCWIPKEDRTKTTNPQQALKNKAVIKVK